MKSRRKNITYIVMLFLTLAACDKPATFIQPLGPKGVTEPDPRLFGAWQLTETVLSDEWGMVEVEFDNEFDGKGKTTQGSTNATLVVTLHIVPGRDSEVVAVGSAQQLSVTYEEDAITASGGLSSSWLALTGYPVQVKDEIFFNLKPVGGEKQGLDIITGWERIGHNESGHFIAKVELLNENTLEIRPVMTAALSEVFKTIETGEDGEEYTVSVIPKTTIDCGWGCSFSVYDPPADRMIEILEANANDDDMPTYRFERLTPTQPTQP